MRTSLTARTFARQAGDRIPSHGRRTILTRTSRKGVFMSPRRRVLLSALVPGLLLVVALAAPARAQFYDAARHALDFSMDGIERSPRLVGMGQLTYVGNDPHTAITLWDFAANPLGILSADSSNTVEIYPATSSLSDVQDLNGQPPVVYERQEQAARESRAAFEIWRRAGGKTAYGLAGDLGQLRWDEVTSETAERRSSLSQPTVMPVLMGRLPYLNSSRWLYSARLLYSGEHSVDRYRAIVQNAQGDFIDQTGIAIDPPESFTPTDYKVRSTGGGVGLGYDRGRAFRAAAAVDGMRQEIKGSNAGARHTSQTHEQRTYSTGQLTFVGRVGRALDWGIDGRGWRSHSIPGWNYSVSAGIGAVPLVGAGELLSRKEEGTALRARLRWTRGPLEFGGGLTTGYRKVTITPPALNNVSSFNHFRNLIIYRQNADTLTLPDSVSASVAAERTWEAGLGMTMRVGGNRGLWGIEFHRRRGVLDQTLYDQVLGAAKATVLEPAQFIEGPLHRGWDLRTGLEYRCTNVLTCRAGYVYRWDDQDDFTAQNEYLGHTMTLGAGIKPAGAAWTLEAGYAVQWLRADFGSPVEPRGSRQQLASMVRLAF
jgi:hypothetical protein